VSEDDLWSIIADDDDDTGSARHGVWGLLLIALAAVTVVALAGFLIESPGRSKPPTQIDNLGQGVFGSSSASSHPTRSSSPPAPHPTTSKSASGSAARKSTSPSGSSTATKPRPASTPTPTPTPTHSRTSSPPPIRNGPCPNPYPCIVSQDVGDAGAYAEVTRLSGSTTTSGTITGGAQTCALSKGDNCPPAAHACVPVPTLNGRAAVDEAVNLGAKDWLVANPKLTVFQIGWAYFPSQGVYYFAIIEGPRA
jgi:hypothetical protein